MFKVINWNDPADDGFAKHKCSFEKTIYFYGMWEKLILCGPSTVIL